MYCKLLLVPSNIPTRMSVSVPGVFGPTVTTIVAQRSTSPSRTLISYHLLCRSCSNVNNPVSDTGRGTNEHGKVVNVVWCQEMTAHTTVGLGFTGR